MEERLKSFDKKAEEFIGQNEEEDLDILPQFTGWDADQRGDENDDELDFLEDEDEVKVEDEVEVEVEDKDADEDDDEDDDEERNIENLETRAISMPSSLKQDDLQRLGLDILAAQELELRKGQASDCLQSLRMALGHKSVLYRTKV